MLNFDFVRSIFLYGWIPEWPKGTDCKSAANCFGGSNPPPSIRWCGGIGRRKGLKIPRGQPRIGSSPITSSYLCEAKRESASLFCYGDEENGHCARASGHLTTANQSEIRKAYLISVIHDEPSEASCLHEKIHLAHV